MSGRKTVINLAALPAEVLSVVFGSHLKLADGVRLDTACCNRRVRSRYLATQIDFFANQYACGRLAKIRWSQLESFMKWTRKRHILISELSLSKPVKQPRFGEWRLQGLRALHVTDFNNLTLTWWRRFITMCPRVTVLSVTGKSGIFESLNAVSECCSLLSVVKLLATSFMAEVDNNNLVRELSDKCRFLTELYCLNCESTDFEWLKARNTAYLMITRDEKTYNAGVAEEMFNDTVAVRGDDGNVVMYCMWDHVSTRVVAGCIREAMRQVIKTH